MPRVPVSADPPSAPARPSQNRLIIISGRLVNVGHRYRAGWYCLAGAHQRDGHHLDFGVRKRAAGASPPAFGHQLDDLFAPLTHRVREQQELVAWVYHVHDARLASI